MKGRTNSTPAQISSGGTLITTIRLDQTISDPNSMITVIEDTGAITTIRKNSHRYVGKYDSTNKIMKLYKLDDHDSTKYDSDKTDVSVNEDVFMKLPRFFYYIKNPSEDIYEISFVIRDDYGSDSTLDANYLPPTTDYYKWYDNNLIGAYEGSVSSGILYSRRSQSVTTTTSSVKAFTLMGYASSRSGIISSSDYDYRKKTKITYPGFTLVRLEQHTMMALLFMAYYKTTNSASMLGRGGCNIDGVEQLIPTGTTATLGMEDTIAGVNGDTPGMGTNFWGLENWIGNAGEFLQVSGQVDIGDGYISKMNFKTGVLNTTSGVNGFYDRDNTSVTQLHMPYLELKEVAATSTTGYCGYWYDGGSYPARGYYYSREKCSIFSMDEEKTYKNTYGSRLSYFGPIEIVS